MPQVAENAKQALASRLEVNDLLIGLDFLPIPSALPQTLRLYETWLARSPRGYCCQGQ